jgi:hypothetical protein
MVEDMDVSGFVLLFNEDGRLYRYGILPIVEVVCAHKFVI